MTRRVTLETIERVIFLHLCTVERGCMAQREMLKKICRVRFQMLVLRCYQAIVPAPLGLVEQLSSCVLGGSLAVDS